MAIGNVATVTQNWLVVSKKKVQPGDPADPVRVLAARPKKNFVRVAPRELFRNEDDINATFITGTSFSPIQNMRNFVRGLERFEVRRAPLAINKLMVIAQGKSVRTRVLASTHVTRMEIQDHPAAPLDLNDAFGCWTTGTADPLVLPPANADSLGLEYYFAAKPGTGMTIRVDGGTDKIQVREKEEVPTAGGNPTAEGTSLTNIPKAARLLKTSVILVCRQIVSTGRYVWVAESLSVSGNVAEWTLA